MGIPNIDSFRSQVLSLEPGESVGKILEVNHQTEVRELAVRLPLLHQQLRNTVSGAVRQAKAIKCARYSVEVGDVMMRTGGYYILAVVKRKN